MSAQALEALEAKARELCRAERTDERDDALAYLTKTFVYMSVCVQWILQDHEDAGERWEELATDCNRALVNA